MRYLLLILLCWIAIPVPATQDGTGFDELLKRIEREGREMALVEREREKRFLADTELQAERLANAREQLAQLEALNKRLRTAFESNQQRLTVLEHTVDDASKDMRSIYHAARQTAEELASVLKESVVSAEYPGRELRLQTMLDAGRPPALEDIRTLWYLLLHEMIETGRVSGFTAPVTSADGRVRESDVTRIGSFNITTNQNFLRYKGGRLFEPARQPDDQLRQRALEFSLSSDGLNAAVVDPARGAAFDVLEKTPGTLQRVQQGGAIGYLVIVLGGIGLLTGVWRLFDTAITGRRMRQQLRYPDKPCDNNPLGRVLIAGRRFEKQDPAHLELHLQEAALREIPRLTLAQGFLKLLAAVAPLLGLLGTVTGMIITFQAISLAGGANASMMAEGIGQALVTTVLGLVSAIPILFVHNLLVSRSRSLIQMLDQETAGLIAQGGKSCNV